MNRLFWALPFLFALPACVSDRGKDPQKYWLSQGYVRSASERETLMARADKGDTKACEELSNYYIMIEQDHEKGIHWLKKAVELDPSNERFRHNLTALKNIEEK